MLLDAQTYSIGLHLGLVIIFLALIAAAGYAFSRFAAPRLKLSGKNRRLKLEEQLFLNNHHSVYLIKVDNTEWLLTDKNSELIPVNSLAGKKNNHDS
jgi:flagellar biogenesis protein FliO